MSALVVVQRPPSHSSCQGTERLLNPESQEREKREREKRREGPEPLSQAPVRGEGRRPGRVPGEWPGPEGGPGAADKPPAAPPGGAQPWVSVAAGAEGCCYFRETTAGVRMEAQLLVGALLCAWLPSGERRAGGRREDGATPGMASV